MARQVLPAEGGYVAPATAAQVATAVAVIQRAAEVPLPAETAPTAFTGHPHPPVSTAPAPTPSPSIIHDIGKGISTIIHKVESFGGSALASLEHELTQILPQITDLVRSSISDVYGALNDTKTWAEQHFGSLIGGAITEARHLFSDARHEAAHLVDDLRHETTAVSNQLSNDLHRIEHAAGSDLTKIEHAAGDIARAVVGDVLKPVEHFVANSEGWFASNFKRYAHDVEHFVAGSEGWFSHEFTKRTVGVESFLQDPLGWFEHNWTKAAGDLLAWTEPEPMRLLALIPKVIGWLELLASTPWDELKAMGRALQDPGNTDQAVKTLTTEHRALASKAVARFLEMRG